MLHVFWSPPIKCEDIQNFFLFSIWIFKTILLKHNLYAMKIIYFKCKVNLYTYAAIQI